MLKLFTGTASLLAALAICVTSAATAGAETNVDWLHGGVALATNEEVKVAGSGLLSIRNVEAGYTILCRASEEGELVGELLGNGSSFFRPFRFSKCSRPSPSPCPKGSTAAVLARGEQNFWEGRLISTAPIRDEIQELELEVHCNGTLLGDQFRGPLSPAVGEESFLRFIGGSGELESRVSGNHLVLSGRVGIAATSGSPSVTAAG
jgi:hypothetical protein